MIMKRQNLESKKRGCYEKIIRLIKAVFDNSVGCFSCICRVRAIGFAVSLIFFGCSETEYLNLEHCKAFAEAQKEGEIIDIARCNAEADYFESLRNEFVMLKASSFRAKHSVAFDSINSWSTAQKAPTGQVLERPPHGPLLGTDYAGPADYRIKGWVSLTKRDDSSRRLLYRTTPTDKRPLHLTVSRIPEPLIDKLLVCASPALCPAEVAVAVESTAPFPGFEAKVSSLRLERLTKEQARELIAAQRPFCFRKNRNRECLENK